jgi:hypothetical protein
MKQTVEIWDKQSPINGVTAEAYLKSNPNMSDPTVLLVKTGSRVTRIESVDTMKIVYEWEGDDGAIAARLEEFVNAAEESTVRNNEESGEQTEKPS